MMPSTLLAVVVVLGEWTGLARAILGGPYYAAGLDVVLVGTLVWAAWEGRGRRSLLRALLPGCIAAYFVLAAVEVLNPNVPELRAGLEGFRKTAFTMVAFYITLLAPLPGAAAFYRIVAIGSIPALLMAVRQALAPLQVELDIISSSGVSSTTFHSGVVLRAFSPTAGPFHMGAIAALVGVIALVLAAHGRWRWIAVATLAGVALGLTITRADMTALAVAAVLLIILAPTALGRVRAVGQAAAPMAAMGLTVLLAIGAIGIGPGGIEPAGPSPAPGATPTAAASAPTVQEVVEGVLNPLNDRNIQFRFGYWRAYLIAIAERPITGYGTSAAADGFDHFYEDTDSLHFAPHSLYLKAALELGLAGLALLLAILALAGLAAWRARRRVTWLGMIGLGSLAVITVSGITGPMLDAYPVNLLVWATVGWMAAAAKPGRDDDASPAAPV